MCKEWWSTRVSSIECRHNSEQPGCTSGQGCCSWQRWSSTAQIWPCKTPHAEPCFKSSSCRWRQTRTQVSYASFSSSRCFPPSSAGPNDFQIHDWLLFSCSSSWSFSLCFCLKLGAAIDLACHIRQNDAHSNSQDSVLYLSVSLSVLPAQQQLVMHALHTHTDTLPAMFFSWCHWCCCIKKVPTETACCISTTQLWCIV